MNINWEVRSINPEQTERIGELLGEAIKVPEVIELLADLGGGKTTFTKGFVHGLGSKDKVASPTFTLNKIYKAKNIQIHHFDFYRLAEPGVVRDQLQESLKDPQVVTVVEWSDIVKDVLPEDRISVEFKAVPDNAEARLIIFKFPQSKQSLIEKTRAKLIVVEP